VFVWALPAIRRCSRHFTGADLASYNDSGEAAEVVGVAIKPPDHRDTHTQVVVRAEQVSFDGVTRPVEGRLLSYLPAGEEVNYGDRVRLWGQQQTPTEDEAFSYKDYLARQRIHSYMPFAAAKVLENGQGNPILAVVYAFKEKGLALIYSYLPDPEASLLAGIVLGVESGIPEGIDQAFKDTGTTHIIAISGFNITIVSGFIAILFSRLLGERRGAVAAVVAISIYTFLVGADAAVVRAAIIGGFSLFARQVGRRQHGLNSLAITAGLMAVFNPLVLWDVGLQLSFAATLG
jgi:competence protein ComEC